jgi:hypothetical protein
MLVSGCLELKEAALATTGDSSSSSADVETAKWQEKGSELMREANELRKKAQELKKQSAVNKYGTEEQLKKDMRLYLQHKKSLANFNGFTEGMALALAFVSLRFLSLSSLSRFSAPLLAHGADIQQSENSHMHFRLTVACGALNQVFNCHSFQNQSAQRPGERR